MELQVALDRMPLERAVDITAAVSPLADWIEVGTSLIKRYGMHAVETIVDAAAGTPVLADLKTADDARWEFAVAYDGGARSATVLGLAAAATIDTAVQVAEEHDREVMVDLMGLDQSARAALATRLPGHVVLAAHIGKDSQAHGHGPIVLLGPWARGRRVAVAGGLGVDDIPALAGVPSLRVIVGSAVTGADDPAAAVSGLLTAARTAEVAR